MDERILEHLKRLNNYRLRLLEMKQLTRDEFLHDDMRQAAVERLLHLSIESCLNIGNRLVSLFQFEKPIETPETYADVFKALHHLGVVDEDFSKRLVQMAKFRNRLVHAYWDLEKEAVYQILQDCAVDFQIFQESVVGFLNKQAHLR
jgi:uncharacterized protein YutE (UPF0331/DUF86 family)